MAYLYILYSTSTNRYYVGATENLERRITEHDRGNTLSTKSGKPWVCVFRRECASIIEAKNLERKLKRFKSRVILERIIKDGFIKG